MGALFLGCLGLGATAPSTVAMEPSTAAVPASALAAPAAAWRGRADQWQANAEGLYRVARDHQQGIEYLAPDLQPQARADGLTFLAAARAATEYAIAAALTAAEAEAMLHQAVEEEADQHDPARPDDFRNRLQALDRILEARQACLGRDSQEPRFAHILRAMAQEQAVLRNAHAQLQEAMATGISAQALRLLEAAEELTYSRIPLRPPCASECPLPA